MLRGRAIAVSLPEESGVRNAFIDILLDDCYGLDSMSEASTILDVGANVGLFSLAARIAFPKATIHAYEPNSALESHLSTQAAGAGFRYFLEAVGKEDGRVRLEVHDDSVQTRSHRDPMGLVPQIAFRTAVARLGGTVTLVKLDCEGAEWDLLGDYGTWHGVQRLVMEYHLWSAHTHGEARMLVAALGFTVIKQEEPSDYGLLLARR
jgi:FkbM family methyltransferase